VTTPSPVKFGTDGWRGIIADDFTFENVRLVAQSTADYFSSVCGTDNGPERAVFIGYDVRFLSNRFAEATAEVFAGNGFKVVVMDRPYPTPYVSYEVQRRNFVGGIVITASHNPPDFNGFKVKAAFGGSAPPAMTTQIEAGLGRSEVRRSSIGIENVPPEGHYARHLKSLLKWDRISSSGLNVMVDSMHGAGGGYFAKLLSGGSSVVTELRADRNPAFPGMAQPEPLAHNLKTLMTDVGGSWAHVGLATDGDAYRLGVVDETGKFITTLDTFALLCYHQLEVLGNRGPLVRSITMTSMIDKLGDLYGVPVFDTPVGFKYLGQVMMREDALTAGEESGGYAFRGNIPERDGILSGLMMLDLIVKSGRTVSELLSDLTAKVGPHHYDRVDLHFDAAEREVIEQRVKAAQPSQMASREVEEIDTRDGYRFVLTGGYWALVRFSGTEPLLRVYAEAESPEEVQSLLTEARSLAGV